MSKSEWIFGSARHDENGEYHGGKKGDQEQETKHDYKGEVSMQKFYVHKKGWYVLRAKSTNVASKLAGAMIAACDNANIGYNQDDRNGIIKYGVETKTKCNCDCSSLVRACVKYASGKDVGDFYTGDEKSVLEKSGLFEKAFKYKDGDTLFNGDILLTCSKGHTGIICHAEIKRSAVKTFTTKTACNLREKAGKTSKFMKVIPEGKTYEFSKVEVVDDTNWYYADKLKGWISGKCVKVN